MLCVISGFHCEVGENCYLLGCYAVSRGDDLLTFRDKLSVPYSRIKNCPLKIGPTGCPETWVMNYHHSLRNNPEERSSFQLHVLYVE